MRIKSLTKIYSKRGAAMKEKILLVEDEEITREGITEFLTVKGYNVVAVGDGEEAINVFERTMDFELFRCIYRPFEFVWRK